MAFTQEEKLFHQVVTEAWDNADFKAELVANPVAAIEKLTGQKLVLPEGKTIVVKDQTAENTVFINVPAKQEMEDAELSDAQLEVVSGGLIDDPFGGCFPPNPFDLIDIIKNPYPTIPDTDVQF